MGGAIGSGLLPTSGIVGAAEEKKLSLASSSAPTAFDGSTGEPSVFGDVGAELAFTRHIVAAGLHFTQHSSRRGGEVPTGAHVDALGEAI